MMTLAGVVEMLASKPNTLASPLLAHSGAIPDDMFWLNDFNHATDRKPAISNKLDP